MTPTLAYNDYDFATGTSGEKFDCENPVNDSPNNTGLTELPPAQPADVWYGYGESEEFPILGTGGSAPMGGPVYRYDPELESEIKFPEYYDGKAFFYEWARNRIYTITFDEQGECDTIIEDVEVLLDSIREELHLYAENRGAMVGAITFTDKGDEINCARMGSGGYAIPSICEPEL